MKARRRAVFATPFVVVAGCSQPVDRAPARTPTIVHANPPEPDAAPAPPAPKRTAFHARITRVDIVDGHSVVHVAAGSADGVDKAWRARFVDDLGRTSPVPCEITTVGDHDLLCRYDATGGPAAEVLLEALP